MTKKPVTDLNAEDYASNSEIQLTLSEKLLQDYSFKHDAFALDIGCGDGRITSEIAKQVPNGGAVGVDASPSMIEHARTHYPKSEFPNLEFVLEKAENLSLSEKFDNIVSFNCFHWVRPWKETLGKLYTFLKPGGEILMLTYPNESPYYRMFENAAKHFPDYVDQAACSTMFTSEELLEALQQLGMKVERFEPYKSVISYENAKEMKDFVRIWLTSFIPLPQELHEKFLNRLIEKAAPYQIDKGDDKIHLPYTALFIQAQK